MGYLGKMFENLGKIYLAYKVIAWTNNVRKKTKSAWNFTADKISEKLNSAKNWLLKKNYYWTNYNKWLNIRTKEERKKINVQQNIVINAQIYYKQVEREAKRKLEEMKKIAKRDNIYEYLEPDFRQIEIVLDNFDILKMMSHISASNQALADRFKEILIEVNTASPSNSNSEQMIDNDRTDDNDEFFDAVEELESNQIDYERSS
ncbi:hypothetical protein [Spiroplasma phoeniceum]|uniref:Uncharacterized protein n=1 Tax=Spiroplasma phoeniceum P40 TaxID=1276259 RepID=A0A345DQ59_9MOLU|nr:hypothetical protein [Spiroplasma phoeniceum]AXF96347.1 hypothetical protein SDAV_001380 [Spiroplasma phoeniceum P40]